MWRETVRRDSRLVMWSAIKLVWPAVDEGATRHPVTQWPDLIQPGTTKRQRPSGYRDPGTQTRGQRQLTCSTDGGTAVSSAGRVLFLSAVSHCMVYQHPHWFSLMGSLTSCQSPQAHTGLFFTAWSLCVLGLFLHPTNCENYHICFSLSVFIFSPHPNRYHLT